jgi:hypothetical protein
VLELRAEYPLGLAEPHELRARVLDLRHKRKDGPQQSHDRGEPDGARRDAAWTVLAVVVASVRQASSAT